MKTVRSMIETKLGLEPKSLKACDKSEEVKAAIHELFSAKMNGEMVNKGKDDDKENSDQSMSHSQTMHSQKEQMEEEPVKRKSLPSEEDGDSANERTAKVRERTPVVKEEEKSRSGNKAPSPTGAKAKVRNYVSFKI